MKIHVHVYELAARAEIDLDIKGLSEDDAFVRAMEEALAAAKRGDLTFKESDNKFMVIPFIAEEKENEDI